MKDNFLDDVLEGVMKRVNGTIDEMTGTYKDVKPFDKVPVSEAQLYKAYSSLKPEDVVWLMQRHGREAVNQFFGEMDQRRKENGS